MDADRAPRLLGAATYRSRIATWLRAVARLCTQLADRLCPPDPALAERQQELERRAQVEFYREMFRDIEAQGERLTAIRRKRLLRAVK